MAPIVLARCAIEHSAHAIWIISDPAEDPQDRLARAFLEEIHGAEQAKMPAGRLLEKSSEEHRRRAAHYKAVERDAKLTFEPPYQTDDGRPVLRGHQMPSPEAIVLYR